MEKRKKYEREGESLNFNKGTVRTKETVKVNRLYVEKNARSVSCSVMDFD